MARYCDGELAAFLRLYQITAPRILTYLATLTSDAALAKDLLQETFLRLHEQRSHYVRGANPAPWISTLAHACFLHRQKQLGPRAAVAATSGDRASPMRLRRCATPRSRFPGGEDPVIRRDARLAPVETTAPPPGPVLLAALEGMVAVRPRSPRKALAAIVAVALAYPAFVLWQLGPRSDLAALSVAWVVGTAVAWAAVSALLLIRAVLPPPGRGATRFAARRSDRRLVGRRAGAAGPGRHRGGARRHQPVDLPARLVGLHLHRPAHRRARAGGGRGGALGLHPVGSGRVGAALGTAGGALAGLLLHFVCGLSSGFHVSLAHGGVSVLGALLGALLLRPLLRA